VDRHGVQVPLSGGHPPEGVPTAFRTSGRTGTRFVPCFRSEGFALVRRILYMALALLFVGGCDARSGSAAVQVLRTLPHDPGAYTQGLQYHEGRLYESTGGYGTSTLREVELETGEVLRQVELPEDHFGEGLALVGDRLIQLTWKENVAFVYDLATFELTGVHTYEGDGWGLCYDGESLYMTTGGSILYRRDPETFELLDTRSITLDGRALREVNELACVGDHIYANVFMSDRIVRIEKSTGVVVEQMDGTMLIPEGGRPSRSDAVLNGIAYNPESGTFYLTGKLWPSLFEVRFVPD